MKIVSTGLGFILSIALATNSFASNCSLKQIFSHPTKIGKDANGKAKIRNISVFGIKDAIFFTSTMAVNTDGAPTSYHPDDPAGNKGLAINTICNGANAVMPNGKVINYSKCQELLDAYRRAKEAGWTDKNQPRMDFFAISHIGGVPCTISGGDYAGYFVSTTKLPADQQKKDCDQAKWLNALDTPFIIVPKKSKFIKSGVNQGDLAVLYNAKKDVFAYAIVGDEGPNWGLAEGSVALAKTLLQRNDDPKTRKDTYKYAVPNANIMIFAGSSLKGPYTKHSIDKAGEAALQSWGGRENFKKCVETLGHK